MNILIVSFDKSLVKKLRDALKEYNVIDVKNGEDAINTVSSFIDIVIYDAVSGSISEEDINSMYKHKFKDSKYIVLVDDLFPVDMNNIMPPRKIKLMREEAAEKIMDAIMQEPGVAYETQAEEAFNVQAPLEESYTPTIEGLEQLLGDIMEEPASEAIQEESLILDKFPFAPFLNALSAPILPKHKLEKYVKEGTFMTAWNVNTDPKEIVGTGPYVIKRYIKGVLVEYTANPYYYEYDQKGIRLPYIKSKIGYIVQDPDTSLLKYSLGEIDYMGVRPQDVLFMSKMKETTLFDMGPTPSTTFLAFNMNPRADIPKYKLKWFQNREFRRAIYHAIDRIGMCYLVYNGLAEPLYGPITPANRPYYEDGLFPVYDYNLKKAKAILENIGFRDIDGDGWLEDQEGHKVEIVLLTNAGNKEREAMGNMIKEDLEKIGIKVIFRPIDFNTLVGRLTSPPYSWEAVIIGLTGSMDPHFGRNVWHSSGTLHMWNPRQEKPLTEWEKRIDELFDKGAIETDQEKRIMFYREAYRMIAEEQPIIFLTTPKSMLAARDKFGNLFPTVWGWYKEEALFIK